MDSSDSAGSNAKDFGKKKLGNKHAKDKLRKLDARREQCLEKVKSKENFEAVFKASNDVRAKSVGMDVKNVDVEEKKGWSQHKGYWDSSPSNSSPGSFRSLLASNSSGAGFSGSSISSGGCWSGSITEEEEENDEYLDDWEAVADALGLGDKKIDPSPDPEGPLEPTVCQDELSIDSTSEVKLCEKGSTPESLKVPMNGGACRAWKRDDAFRPQSLPNLTKQYSCPANSDKHYEHGSCGSWVHSNLLAVPSSCPICYEDLDVTDSSFMPCLCGFRLCLFCHKRILEEDGRCPGCRKPYEENGPVESKPILNGGTSYICLGRSFSMVTGSRN